MSRPPLRSTIRPQLPTTYHLKRGLQGLRYAVLMESYRFSRD